MPEAKHKKVLFIVQHLSVGGLENVVLNLCLGLTHSPLQPVVWIYDSIPGQPNLIEVFRNHAIEVHEEFKPQGFSVRSVLKLRRFILDEKIEIVNTHDLGPLIYGAFVKLLLALKLRIIHTQHSFVHVRRLKKLATYEKVFTRFANQIVAVSEAIEKEYHELGIPPDKISVIPNGVASLSTTLPSAQFKKVARNSLLKNWPQLESVRSLIWVVSVARLFPRKGHEPLLHVWQSLPQALRDQLALIWVGPEAQNGMARKLLDQAKTLPNSEQIIWVGSSLHVNQWYDSSDIFVSASEEEGMPLAPVEAIGHGLPLILSKIDGHRFLIPYSRQYDLNQPAQGAVQLAEIVGNLKSAPEAYLQTNWERTTPLRKHFSSEQMTAGYMKLFLGPK